MPRYHFNVRDGKDYPDPDGTELPDLATAQHEALRYSCGLLSSLDQSFWDGEPWCMEVTDDRGLVLFRLDFKGSKSPELRQSHSIHSAGLAAG